MLQHFTCWARSLMASLFNWTTIWCCGGHWPWRNHPCSICHPYPNPQQRNLLVVVVRPARPFISNMESFETWCFWTLRWAARCHVVTIKNGKTNRTWFGCNVQVNSVFSKGYLPVMEGFCCSLLQASVHLHVQSHLAFGYEGLGRWLEWSFNPFSPLVALMRPEIGFDNQGVTWNWQIWLGLLSQNKEFPEPRRTDWTIGNEPQESYQNNWASEINLVSQQASDSEPTFFSCFSSERQWYWSRNHVSPSSSAFDWADFTINCGMVKSTGVGLMSRCWWVWSAIFLTAYSPSVCALGTRVCHIKGFKLFDWLYQLQVYVPPMTPHGPKRAISIAWYGVPAGAWEIPTTLFSVVMIASFIIQVDMPIMSTFRRLVRQKRHYL